MLITSGYPSAMPKINFQTYFIFSSTRLATPDGANWLVVVAAD